MAVGVKRRLLRRVGHVERPGPPRVHPCTRRSLDVAVSEHLFSNLQISVCTFLISSSPLAPVRPLRALTSATPL